MKIMRKKYFVIMISIVLLCTQFVVAAEDESYAVSNIHIPSGQYVTMNARYGTSVWFKMNFSGVPDGYDMANGTYTGWCIEKNVYMTRDVNHAVLLYSSYDSNMPDEFKDPDWNKINYIINHRSGYSKYAIQDAIWYYIDEISPSDANASIVIAEADQNGSNFIPKSGELVAILVKGFEDGNDAIQRTFFELILPTPGSLGDFVWNDLNQNGLQDTGEPGISNVEVKLLDNNKDLVDFVNTDSSGKYSFNYYTGDYYLKFTLKNGYKFTSKNTGTDDTLDSDVDNTGITDLFSVNQNTSTNSWDAGMYKQDEQPSTPETHQGNHAPTADATTGVPYIAFLGEEITFNGSRSYDIDGYIVNWTWNFGDGARGYGKIINHLYSSSGNFTVVLTVKDNDGALDSYITDANIKTENKAPSKPEIKGPSYGTKNTEYYFTANSTDPDNDSIQYTFSWGDEKSSVSVSEFIPSNEFFSTSFNWSKAGRYIVTVKASDKKDETISEKVVYISAIELKDIGYLTDDNGDGIYDLFHKANTSQITQLTKQSNGNYRIDYNGDGVSDYEFNPTTNNLVGVEETQTEKQNNYLPIIIGIIAILAILIIVLIIVRRRKK
jgi:hypothetical protein